MSQPNLDRLIAELTKLGHPSKAKTMARFFKTGPGEYGEGDIFIGVTVPDQRKLAKKYLKLSLPEIKKLLQSQTHEQRLVALLILVEQYRKANGDQKKQLVDFYLENIEFINNWDLVDSSADRILGDYLMDRDKHVIYTFAKSQNLWEKRVAVMATFQFIKNHRFEDAFNIFELLLTDSHDLIHKAIGWMLREIGKRNLEAELAFLDRHYQAMPRTTLRYAIERLDPQRKAFYMRK